MKHLTFHSRSNEMVEVGPESVFLEVVSNFVNILKKNLFRCDQNIFPPDFCLFISSSATKIKNPIIFPFYYHPT